MKQTKLSKFLYNNIQC